MQQSSSEWTHEAAPEIHTARLDDPDTILDELPGLARDCDFVNANGPGSNTETSRALLLRGDLAIFPYKASTLEARALAQATTLLRQAQDIRGGKPEGVVVLSMAGKQYRLPQDMRDAAVTLQLRLAGPAITLKRIYADAPGQGAVVWQMGARGREAAEELRALFKGLLPEAAQKSKRRKPAAGSRSSRWVPVASLTNTQRIGTEPPLCPSTVSSPTSATGPAGDDVVEQEPHQRAAEREPGPRGPRPHQLPAGAVPGREVPEGRRLATARRPVVSSAPTKSVENRWYAGLVNENTNAATSGRASGGRIMAAVRGRAVRELQQPSCYLTSGAHQNRHRSS